MESRATRIARTLLLVLEARRVQTGDIARTLGVSPRYVSADLQVLSTLMPLRAAYEGRKRFWRVDPAFGVRHLGVLDRISLVLGQGQTGDVDIHNCRFPAFNAGPH